MKRIIGLLIISFCLQAADIAKMDIDISVITSDEVQFDVAESIAFLSPTIKDALTPEAKIKNVGTTVHIQVAAREFKIIKEMLVAVQHAMEQQKNKSPSAIDIIRADGNSEVKKVYIVVDATLEKQSPQELIELIKACNYLELTFFLEPIAKSYVQQLLKQYPKLKLEELDPVLKKFGIPSELYVYFKKYVQLHQWNLSSKSMRDLRESTFSPLGNPNIIQIVGVGLTSLSGIEIIENKQQVETIDISVNFILVRNCDPEFVQSPFKYFTHLKNLIFKENRFYYLSSHFFDGLASLVDLNLNDNYIRVIEENIFTDLHSLERLSLNRTEVTSLSSSIFKGLANLKKLEMKMNKLKVISSGQFSELKNVKVLDLEDGQIEEIKPDAFAGLEWLRVLNLGYHPISKLHEDTFKGLIRLEELSLEGCDLLKDLPEKIFKHQSMLKILNLDFVGFENFPISSLDRATALEKLIIRGANFENKNELVKYCKKRSIKLEI